MPFRCIVLMPSWRYWCRPEAILRRSFIDAVQQSFRMAYKTCLNSIGMQNMSQNMFKFKSRLHTSRVASDLPTNKPTPQRLVERSLLMITDSGMKFHGNHVATLFYTFLFLIVSIVTNLQRFGVYSYPECAFPHSIFLFSLSFFPQNNGAHKTEGK